MFMSLFKPEYGYYALFAMILLTLFSFLIGSHKAKKHKARSKEFSDEAKSMNMSSKEFAGIMADKYQEEIAKRSIIKKFQVSVYEHFTFIFSVFLVVYPFLLAGYCPFILIFADHYIYHCIAYLAIWSLYISLLTTFIKGDGGMVLLPLVMPLIISLLASIVIVSVRLLIDNV
ncbi:hypothetical protein [Pseudoalteromonas sp. A3]|uniref:hypothetical protein n=1 Tax=Pseudoalteromonas sp. A3 TaxID=142792 RepID=UPI00221E3FE6|nr:hypothetical protein [Pseudoalteromonas sp. A3]